MISRRSFVQLGLAATCCAVVAVAAAQPAPTPQQFAWHQSIETTSGEAIQRFALSAETYAGAARPDLGDLRIFNAAGEVLPYALVRREAQAETLTQARQLGTLSLALRSLLDASQTSELPPPEDTNKKSGIATVRYGISTTSK